MEEEANQGYEGATVRLKQQCPLCKGEMEDGFLIDHTYGGFAVSEWAEGSPTRSIWTGLKMGDKRRYKVVTFRCEQCGFLASYGTTPLNDG